MIDTRMNPDQQNNSSNLTAGASPEPRFEFRSFGQDFDAVHYKMARLSAPVPKQFQERQSNEIYIVSITNSTYNTKIRDGKIDIKKHLRTFEGLEQWNPVMKNEFPLSAEVLATEIFPAFDVAIPDIESRQYSLSDFLHLINIHPDLLAIRVNKRRFGYIVNDTICEYGIVLINGARVVTISTESTRVEAIKKTIRDVGLMGVENINYLQAIKRVTGMINKPLANE
jgi:hypothetical protein